MVIFTARRGIIVCVQLRTNVTLRELAAMFAISKSQAHRIIADLTPQMAMLLAGTAPRDRRRTWILDGTLVPTRDHRHAAKSKNYRWSCNLQLVVQRRGLRIAAIDGGGPGNRTNVGHPAALQLAWPRPRRRRLPRDRRARDASF